MVYKDFVFFDSESTGTVSNVLIVPNQGEELRLHVTGLGGGVDLVVEGKTDIVDGSWATLGCISLKDFSIGEAIKAEGEYAVAAGGIQKIRITNNGTAGGVKVFGFVLA